MSPGTSARDLQIENLKKEVELLRAELEKIKMEVRPGGQGQEEGPQGHRAPRTLPSAHLQAQRYVAQLKGQVNALEAELEDQRKQKQKALVDNEQLRHELAQLRAAQQEGARNQGLREEAESACGQRGAAGSPPTSPAHSPGLKHSLSPPRTGKASATEARYSKLKEKHSELINTHAELLRKVGAHARPPVRP